MYVANRICTNLAANVRRVRRAGREYLVAPATLLVPGILNGSKGALRYLPADVKASTERWAGVPVCLGHPHDPVAKQRLTIGEVRSPRFVRNRLVADLWFDVERCEALDRRVLDNLAAGRTEELSTGLHTTEEPAENGATHAGRHYRATARDLSPDHLAILPDQVGACSRDDGCGVLVNERNLTMLHKPQPLPSEEDHLHDLGYIPEGDVWVKAPSRPTPGVTAAPRRTGPRPLPSNEEIEYDLADLGR